MIDVSALRINIGTDDNDAINITFPYEQTIPLETLWEIAQPIIDYELKKAGFPEITVLLKVITEEDECINTTTYKRNYIMTYSYTTEEQPETTRCSRYCSF